jgi:hypothetical protein
VAGAEEGVWVTMTHNLQGLLKWSERDEWRAAFADHVSFNMDGILREHGVGPEKLIDLLTENEFSLLNAVLFESFMSVDDGEGSLADDYLKRRGWKESPGQREYIAALRDSVMSLYEISDVVKGEGFRLRDLVRGGEPIQVRERSGSKMLKTWDRIAARVVKLRDHHEVGGGILLFDHHLSDELLEALSEWQQALSTTLEDVLEHQDFEIDADKRGAFDETSAMLAASSQIIITAWLDDRLDRVLNPRRPSLANTDGDPFVPTEVRYPLKPGANLVSLRRVLTGHPELRGTETDFWNWFDTTKQARSAATGPETVILMSRLEDGATVLGTIELQADAVVLSTNSEARAARGTLMLDQIISTFTEAPGTVVIDSEGQGDADVVAHKQPSLDLPDEERDSILREFLDKHYADTMDQPIVMLDGQSPRVAVKTQEGRSKVIAWLKYIENGTTRTAPNYDMTWMWRELGLLSERK